MAGKYSYGMNIEESTSLFDWPALRDELKQLRQQNADLSRSLVGTTLQCGQLSKELEETCQARDELRDELQHLRALLTDTKKQYVSLNISRDFLQAQARRDQTSRDQIKQWIRTELLDRQAVEDGLVAEIAELRQTVAGCAQAFRDFANMSRQLADVILSNERLYP